MYSEARSVNCELKIVYHKGVGSGAAGEAHELRLLFDAACNVQWLTGRIVEIWPINCKIMAYKL